MYEALQSMLVDVLSAYYGPSVRASQINATFPELRASFDGSISTADLALNADDEVQEIADALVGCPDELPKRFWQRLGMTMHRNVVVIHSAVRHHHVDLQLLTDGKHDWFFLWWDTNYAGDEYTIGPPTKASRVARKKEILWFAGQADALVSVPGNLTTSLAKEDLQWLRESQDLPVVFRRGTLARL